MKKLIELNALHEIIASKQKDGQKVVFTNGVFDILHVGHVRYLTEARALGSALVVAVNSDLSVRELKGPLRPIVSEDERMEMLAALETVDYVVPFSSQTPVPLLQQLQPAIYAKGGDYRISDLPEAPIVERYGGTVHILSLIEGRSSTNIISRVCAAYCPK